MEKYYMIIDGVEFNGFFEDHIEAADFLGELDRDGVEVIILKIEKVGVQAIMNDNSLNVPEKIEYVAKLVLPNASDFKKYTEQEAELNKLGFTF